MSERASEQGSHHLSKTNPSFFKTPEVGGFHPPLPALPSLHYPPFFLIQITPGVQKNSLVGTRRSPRGGAIRPVRREFCQPGTSPIHFAFLSIFAASLLEGREEEGVPEGKMCSLEYSKGS